MHWVCLAFSALRSAGNSNPARMAMIATTREVHQGESDCQLPTPCRMPRRGHPLLIVDLLA
jgi:hypothetical protein